MVILYTLSKIFWNLSNNLRDFQSTFRTLVDAGTAEEAGIWTNRFYDLSLFHMIENILRAYTHACMASATNKGIMMKGAFGFTMGKIELPYGIYA